MIRTVSAVLCLSFSSVLVACGASTPEPAAPEPAGAPAEENVEPTAAPAEAAADESWEGEEEATGGSAAPGEAAPAAASSTEETRTTEVVAKIVKDNRKQFRDCYEKGTKDLPDVQGTLTLHFVLDGEGKVKKAELNQERSTIKAPPVVDCALLVLRSLKFPPSSRGMESTVNYPFDFKR